MFEIPRELTAAERARWLAELSEALDQAQKLVWSIGLGPTGNSASIELYVRIEAARLEVRALRLRSRVAPGRVIDPKWIEPLPWQRQASGIG